MEFIVSNQKFLVIGHKNPDGDCAGAQVALVHFLRRIGKEAVAFSHGPFQRLEIEHLKTEFINDISRIENLAEYAVIILDASTIDRVGEIGKVIIGMNHLVIDHHMSKANFGGLEFIDSEAPSTTYIILQLIEQMGYEPDTSEAEFLLLGLCTDTGFFRHIENNAPLIFQAVSRLTGAGASVKNTFRQMYGGSNLAERKLLGTVLLKTEEHFENKVIITNLTLKEKEEILPVTMKTEEVYRLLQLVDKVEIVVFIKQEEEKRFSISFRSNGTIMVDKIAEALGGGGHKLAAGCEIAGNYPEIKARVLAILQSYFQGGS